MAALIVGILCIAFAIYAILPVSWSLQWLPAVVQFLKGGLPIAAVMAGLLAILIGIADIKDRIEAKREEEKEREADREEIKRN